jgi:hypothetical protein
VRRNPGATLGLSAVVAVVTQGLTVVLQLLLFRGTALDAADPAALLGLLAGSSVLGVLTWVITLLATSVLTGMLVTVLGEAVLGRTVTWGAAWNRAGGRVPGLVGLSLLAGLAIVAIVLVALLPGIVVGLAVGGGGWGAAIALIVLGGLVGGAAAVWLGVSWSLAAPAYVLESLGVVDALRRSWRLVRGQWWRVFGVVLLGGLIAFVVSSILAVPFGFGGELLAPGDPLSPLSLVLNGLGGVLAATLTTPFSAGIGGLLYVDQRIRREAFDLELGRAVGR